MFYFNHPGSKTPGDRLILDQIGWQLWELNANMLIDCRQIFQMVDEHAGNRFEVAAWQLMADFAFNFVDGCITADPPRCFSLFLNQLRNLSIVFIGEFTDDFFSEVF